MGRVRAAMAEREAELRDELWRARSRPNRLDLPE